MKAFYVNDTAIKAEVYRDHVTDVITDALMALRLNTSTLLHSRLHWRSASLSELQVRMLLNDTCRCFRYEPMVSEPNHY